MLERGTSSKEKTSTDNTYVDNELSLAQGTHPACRATYHQYYSEQRINTLQHNSCMRPNNAPDHSNMPVLQLALQLLRLRLRVTITGLRGITFRVEGGLRLLRVARGLLGCQRHCGRNSRALTVTEEVN